MPAVYDSEEEDETYGRSNGGGGGGGGRSGSYTPSITTSRSLRQRSTSLAIRSGLRRNNTTGNTTSHSATPLGSDDDEQEDDDDDEDDEEDDDEEDRESDEDRDEGEEPAEIDDDDLDPINSGQATPSNLSEGIRKSKALNFHKKKEQKQTIKGQTYAVVNDELQLDDDPRGDTKIDAMGNLLGGREWRVKTFTSHMRPNPKKLYMLSIDAARAAGFRDSLYFFRKNPLVHKLGVNQPEKDRLIAEGKVGINYKSRTVTMVSARNVFKVMGALFVKDGKYVFDDYYEDKSLAAGHRPGEPAWLEGIDPSTVNDESSGTASVGLGSVALPGSSAAAPKRAAVQPKEEYVTIIGGHTAFGGSGLQPFAKTWDPTSKKARPAAQLSVDTWMLEYARAVRRTDTELANTRRGNMGQVQLNPSGVGDREEDAWIEVEEDLQSDEETEDNRLKGIRAKKRVKVYNPIRGIYEPETNVPHIRDETQATRCRIEQIDSVPHLWEGDEPTGKDSAKRRKIEEAASKIGIATIEYAVDDEAASRRRRQELIPGMWDFRN